MMSVIPNPDHFPSTSAYRLEEPRRLKTKGTLKGPSTLLSIQLQDTTLLWAAIDSILNHKKCKRHYIWCKKQRDDPTLAFRSNVRFRKYVAQPSYLFALYEHSFLRYIYFFKNKHLLSSNSILYFSSGLDTVVKYFISNQPKNTIIIINRNNTISWHSPHAHKD